MLAVTGSDFSRVVFRLGSGLLQADLRDALASNHSMDLDRCGDRCAAAGSRARLSVGTSDGVWNTSGSGTRVTGVRISNRDDSDVVSRLQGLRDGGIATAA